MEKDKTTIGNKLRLLRTRKGLSQADVAAYLHVSRSCYQAYEGGTREAARQTLNRLAEFFETPIEVIVNDNLEIDNVVKETVQYNRRKSDDEMLLELSHKMTYEEYKRFIAFGRNLLKRRDNKEQ